MNTPPRPSASSDSVESAEAIAPPRQPETAPASAPEAALPAGPTVA